MKDILKIVFCAALFVMIQKAYPHTNRELLSNLKNFFDHKITILATELPEQKLPVPYDFFLTQPLMTVGIEKYYHRNTKVSVLSARKNASNNTYTRAIIMLLDPGVSNEAKINHPVEFAIITINFNELSPRLIESILNTATPFGKLLQENNIKIFNTNRSYFSVKCDEALYKYLHCSLGSQIYGRTNTLVKQSNGKWLAQVVEIVNNPA